VTARQPRRHGPAARYVSPGSSAILARCYPGQVPAAVIERALTEMAKRDGHGVTKVRRQT
jgi:hypothetical protein